MELKLREATMLKKILKMVQKFVKQVKFTSLSSHFGFNCMSETKDVNFQLKILKESFKTYKPSKEAIILDLEYFNKVLSRYNEEDTLWIKENKQKNKIAVMFENQEIRYFEISTEEEYQGTEKELDITENEFFQVIIKIKPFLETLKDIKAIEGEAIEFSVENSDMIQIKSRTEMLNDTYEYILPQTMISNVEGIQNARSTYSMNIIGPILSCGFETAKFYWKNDDVLKIQFKNDTLEFVALIAPRAEETDEEADEEFMEE